MNNNSVEIPSLRLRFIGCTLWTDIPESHEGIISEVMNDYNYITLKDDLVTTRDIKAIHKNSVEYLKGEVAIAKVVLLSLGFFLLFRSTYHGADRQIISEQ